MTDELVRGIRRIVGDLDEKPKGIGDAEARKPIGISRGIAYIGRDGGVSSSGSAEGGGNDTSPPNVPQPDTDPDNGAPGDTGGVNDGSTGGGTGSALTGDAAVVDATAAMGSEIGQITGTDPASGGFSTLNLTPLEGIEYTPPDGWDDPDSPPCPVGYEEGFYWEVAGGANERGYIYQEAADTQFGPSGWQLCSIDASGNQVTVTTAASGFNCGNSFGRFLINKRSCAATGNPAPFCTVIPCGPTSAEPWPSDSTCDIVYDFDSGGYKGHERDPDCSTDQKQAQQFTIIRSKTQPDKYFRYTRLSDGGTKVTQVDSSGAPVPGSITKTIGPDGRVNGFYDVSLDAGIN